MSRFYGVTLSAVALAVACAAALSGCSLLPTGSWAEPVSQSVNGVQLVKNGASALSLAAPAATAPVELSSLDIMPLRLRNDAVHLAARFAYVPGSNEFNTWINAKLWKEIQSTNVAYKPQAQAPGAGFGDRGCIQGSSTWPAAEILARPATGPLGASGIAMVCDVRATYGNQIEIAIRTVAGSPAGVSRDETDVRIVNTITGDVLNPAERWSDASSAALWDSVVTLLKRDSGTPSPNNSEVPSETQLTLVKKALNGARALLGGDLLVTIPAGLTSPQLAEHGIAATTGNTDVTVSAPTARSWMGTALRSVQDDGGTPFLGIHRPMSDVAIDCTLVPCVALTYDDGPTIYSAALLDTLKSQRVNATFFLIGINVNKMPDIVARSAREGNELGTHTMDHRDLTKLSVADARAQLISGADAISKITGNPVKLFRAPYGAVNQNIINAAGLPAINWNVDPNDWVGPGQPALLARTIPVARADSIILMHEIKNDSVQVAKSIIQGLRDRGFEPVTISQLFGSQLPVQNLREVKR